MKNNQLIARITGILFIIGTAAGILSVVFTNPILNDPNYLTIIAVNENQIVMGSIFILIMGFSLAMIPAVLFPIFKRHNEILALGAILFRGALEAFLYIGIVVCWLLLMVLGRQYADATDTSSLQAMGTLLQEAGTWNNTMLAIVFSLGALMIYWLFYISRSIPRWLSIWGLVGAVLYLATPLLTLFGLDQFGALMAPLAVQEMVLAVWLIVKGFNPIAVAPASNNG